MTSGPSKGAFGSVEGGLRTAAASVADFAVNYFVVPPGADVPAGHAQTQRTGAAWGSAP